MAERKPTIYETKCPGCKKYTLKYKHGKTPKTAPANSFDDQYTRRQKWRCQDCGHVFTLDKEIKNGIEMDYDVIYEKFIAEYEKNPDMPLTKFADENNVALSTLYKWLPETA